MSRQLIWCRGQPDDPVAISYWEAWFGAFCFGGLVQYEHATYPWFLNWRLGAYKDVEAAKERLQFLFDNPKQLLDF